MIRKNIKIISFGLLIISFVFLFWQYIESLKTEGVLAVTIGTHNPGHLWAEMECSNAICIDIANSRIGIGGKNAPTQALDVNGSIKASGSICDGTGACVNNPLGANFTIDGTCGSAESAIFPPTNLFCHLGYPSAVSGGYHGPWSWTCTGIGEGIVDNCLSDKGVFFTGASGCSASVAPNYIYFGGGQAGTHWGGFAATNKFFNKTSSVTVTFDYAKPNGYDSNLIYALNLRVNSNSAGGHASTYYSPTTTYGVIWNNTVVSSSYQSVTVEIKGSTGQYRINGGTWTAVPNWASISSTYNLEFADYGYGNGTATSSIRNAVFTITQP